MPDLALAIDLGGTKTAFGLVSSAGEVIHREEIPTRAQTGGTFLAQHTAEHAKKMIEQASRDDHTVVGVGIGSAGVVGAQGEIVQANNLIKDWSGVPFAAIVQQTVGLPAYATNDVHAHALGEAAFGAAATAPTALVVAFGTGVGGSYIVAGKHLAGAHHIAGHVGHFSSPLATGLDCACGASGHVETIASGTAIFANYQRRGGTAASDTRQIAALAQEGDSLARLVIEEAGKAAGLALSDLANILDPHLIVVSGGVANLGELWWSPLRAAYRANAIGDAKDTEIVLASLGGDAPLIGAVSLIPNFLVSKDS